MISKQFGLPHFSPQRTDVKKYLQNHTKCEDASTNYKEIVNNDSPPNWSKLYQYNLIRKIFNIF